MVSSSYPGDLFRSTAPYYAAYRPHYPAAFFEFLAVRFSLDATARVLDLGCGTGRLALGLAPFAAEVVGLDTEPEMLAAAREEALKAGITNVRWVEGSSRDLAGLQPGLGGFRLVMMGESLHWMDPRPTLAALDASVEQGGGIAITWLHPTDAQANHWYPRVLVVVQRWLGKQRRAGSGFYRPPAEPFEDVVAASPFSRFETLAEATSPFRLSTRYDIDSVVGLVYSTSYASPYVLGGMRERFEADLRQSLAAASPSGHFEEDAFVGAILAWRP